MKREQLETINEVVKVDIKKRKVVDYFVDSEIVNDNIRESQKKFVRMHENEKWLQDHLDHLSRIYINVAEREVFSYTKRLKNIKIFIKKSIRKLLRWYINPVCEQQSEFNATCFYAIREVKIILDNFLNTYEVLNSGDIISVEQVQDCVSKVNYLSNIIENIECKEENNTLIMKSIKESNKVLLNSLEKYNSSLNFEMLLNDEMKKYLEILVLNTEHNQNYIKKLEEKVEKLEKKINEVQA